MRASRGIMLMLVVLSAACHCEQAVELATDLSTSTSESTSEASESSTGEPFDASRWVGRYHYENVFLPFGELGDPHGSRALSNFEIFADSRAVMLYDDCSFDEPIVVEYLWEPDEPGWLRLFPGEGESSLRLVGIEGLETLRVQLIEPCRELAFEADGTIVPWSSYYPGESCWVDRCTVPNLMQVDYCEGEEPPPCP